MRPAYGVPFRGSKSLLCEWLFRHIPSAENLYDIFAGGCSVTHYAYLNNRWKNLYSNDIGRGSSLFKECMDGNLWFDEKHPEDAPYPQRLLFLDFESFQHLADTPYEQLEPWENWLLAVWSYTADYKTYKLNKKNVPLFRTAHNAIFDLDLEPLERLLGRDCSELKHVVGLKNRVNLVAEWYEKDKDILEKIPSINNQVHSLYARMWRMNSIRDDFRKKSGLFQFVSCDENPNVEFTNKDYRDVEIKPDSVIYADPPYVKCNYGSAYSIKNGEFDHEEFYNWARAQEVPLLISEYWMPEDFVCIDQTDAQGSTFRYEKKKDMVEKLFVPGSQIDYWKKHVKLN